MQVPCCRGLLQIAQAALQKAKRKVPVKAVVVSTSGDILSEEWL
jgi:ribosomal protein L16/L10AE